jgi:hypothetical protein
VREGQSPENSGTATAASGISTTGTPRMTELWSSSGRVTSLIRQGYGHQPRGGLFG